jgi:carbon-monoxide dehydrogenase small subunit
MATEQEKSKISRRQLLKGGVAGAIVAGVAVGGVAEMQILGIKPSTTTTTNTTTATTTATTTTTVTVNVPDVTAALAATPTTVNTGDPVTFTATPGAGTSPYTFTIDCGDGTTLTANGTHAYAAGGKYVALLTVTDSKGKKGMATMALTVNAQSVTPVVLPVTSKVVTLNVNGVPRIESVQANWSLLEVLRSQFNLFSVKDGCSLGECGACTVIMDGKAVNSCQILAIEAEGRNIVTLEGVSDYGKNLHALQKAFITREAAQCGYCAPGMILSAKALLDAKPKPTWTDIQEALSGNLCTCGNYKKIMQAVADVGGVS